VTQARQQANGAADASNAGAGGPRRRTTSGPQRAPTSFADAHNQNPLPAFSYAPNSVPSHMRPDGQNPTMVHSASANAVTGSGPGGYHPYRRTPRSSTNSPAVLVLPQIQFGSMFDGQETSLQQPAPASDSRARSGSASGPSASKPSTTAASRPAPAFSYSSVAAGTARGTNGPLTTSPASSSPISPTGRPLPASAVFGGQSQGSFDSTYSAGPAYGAARRPSDASSVTAPGAPSINLSHLRTTSFSSQTSASTERDRAGATTPTAPKTSSPLAQQQQPGQLSTAQIGAQKKSLPSRLRKAISMSTMSEFGSAGGDANGAASKTTGRRGDIHKIESGQLGQGGAVLVEAHPAGGSQDSTPQVSERGGLDSSAASISSRRSGRPPISGSGEGGGAKRSLFNRKFNASTDNISISSTVSSASVMLRKMGNLGKLARRHSLMGLTNMFKDKDRGGPLEGRDGLHTDDFGTMTGSGAMADGVENNAARAGEASQAGSAAAAAAGAKVKRGKNKKSAPVAASITHATVELETGGVAMTPAASYVQRLQMRQGGDVGGGPAGVGASPTASPPSQSFLARVRNVSTDSTSTARAAGNGSGATAAGSLAAAVAGSGPGSPAGASGSPASATAAGTENRNQKMFEKERERLKKQRGWKKFMPGSSSSAGGAAGAGPADDGAQAGSASRGGVHRIQPTGLETYAASDEENAPGYGNAMNSGAYRSHNGRPAWSGSSGANVGGGGPLPHSAAALYGEPPNADGTYDDDEGELLEPPHVPYAEGGGESGDEYETDSLRHWGEGIERSRASAAQIKSVKSILRATSAFGPDPAITHGAGGPQGGKGYQSARSPSFSQPRMRSSSFDATQAVGTPGVPLMSQRSNTTEGTDRMDGLSTARAESPSTVLSPVGSEQGGSATTPPLASPTAGVGTTTNLGHHANSSMPTLSLMMEGGGSTLGRKPGGGGARAPKKRLHFAEAHIFHSTWPAHVYDRRGELATCNRLTPTLAQSIKEELNSFKMEEMIVAPTSRIYTHFFV